VTRQALPTDARGTLGASCEYMKALTLFLVMASHGAHIPSPHPTPAVIDRGEAKYFHGRKQILADFDCLLEHYNNNASGGTFLIQGAPGAGKTALLSECVSHAEAAGWRIGVIDDLFPLWRPSALRSAQYNGESLVEGGLVIDQAAGSVLEMLRGGVGPLLLKLDEAQRLEDLSRDLDIKLSVGAVLTAIHNGKVGRPLVLLAGGLGTTAEIFKSLSISRFERRSFVELEGLDTDAERAVIRDWLTEDGRAKGDPTAWIDAIMQKTYGWPQHILSYVGPAVEYLHTHGGVMNKDGLSIVLDAGGNFRTKYYERRAGGLAVEERYCLARIFEDIPQARGSTRKTILSELASEYGVDAAEKLFRRALHSGLLQMTASGHYAIPIPSMQDWLVGNYAHLNVGKPPMGFTGQRSKNLGR